MNDGPGYARLDKLLYYPKDIGPTRSGLAKPGFPENFRLDVLRLNEATGSLTSGAVLAARMASASVRRRS
jgi:hypothetical protein